MAKGLTELKSLARVHTEGAISTLVGVMNQPNAPPAARVAAAEVLLNRGWGKPTQPISGDDDAPAIKLERIERVIVRPDAEDTDG